jgi:hypothetical protein
VTAAAVSASAFDRLGERFFAGQAAVGFDGEGDRDGDAGGSGGADDAGRLLRVGKGVGGDRLGAGGGQRLHL